MPETASRLALAPQRPPGKLLAEAVPLRAIDTWLVATTGVKRPGVRANIVTPTDRSGTPSYRLVPE